MAGYSKTPLAKKLGIREGMRVVADGAPDHYAEILKPLPDGVVIVDGAAADESFVHVFSHRRDELEARLASLVPTLVKDGTLWISWPKKASKVPTDLDGGVVRQLGQATGLVDVKVCAVDDVWSGHKFVYRLVDR